MIHGYMNEMIDLRGSDWKLDPVTCFGWVDVTADRMRTSAMSLLERSKHWGSILEVRGRRVVQGGYTILNDGEFLASFSLSDRSEAVQWCIEDTEGNIAKIYTALQREDFNEIRGCAHSIKGGASYIGASVLMEVARQMEDAARSEYSMRVRHLTIVLSCLEIALGDVRRAYEAILPE